MKIIVRTISVAVLSATLLQGCATLEVNKQPESLYKDGETSFRKGNYEDAITLWKKVKESYQSPELSAKAEIGIADAYFLNKDYIESAAAYEDFRKLHPTHERAAYALYRQGMSYYKEINGIDTDQTPIKNVLSSFESYLRQYPQGEDAAEVKEKIRDCHDKQLQYEIYVGSYYLRTGSYSAAVGRFEEALKAFPDGSRQDELFYNLGLAYRKDGRKSKGDEMLERLVREFPASRYVKDAKKMIGKQ